MKLLVIIFVFKFFFFFPNQVIEAKVLTTFNGLFVQGGVVIGQTEPGSKIILGQKILRISKDGFFLLGFGRDAPPSAKIKIIHPDGVSKDHNFKIQSQIYKIIRIDGLPEGTVTPNRKNLERIKADSYKIKAARQLNTDLTGFLTEFNWPVKGPISGLFGDQRILNGKPRNPHNGVDIAAPKGTPITAPTRGVVSLVDPNMFLSGKTVIIDHGHGLSSIYIHMDQVFVSHGEKIKKGQKLGTVGMTGRATGPHLHWGVSFFNKHVNPTLLITGKN